MSSGVGTAYGQFVRTQVGFLRLDVIVRFDIVEHLGHDIHDWDVHAYDANGGSHPVGVFKSEAEAREVVIRLVGQG